MKNKVQFSKVVISICIAIMFIGILIAVIGNVFFALSEVIATTIVTACGCVGITSVVWYLKKSQAENTVKIYLGAYEKILLLKKKLMNEDITETVDQMESNILYKLDNNLSNAMDEATSPIERQDVY